jgi:DNA-binding CsgD family transcriptional regulator
VRGNGRIVWSTPQATRLVNAATGSDEGLDMVSARIFAWIEDRRGFSGQKDPSFTIETGGEATLSLSFLGSIGQDEHLFRLTSQTQASDGERLRQHFSLTMRESEVLAWIAKGKSNRDIGEILGLSSRTVNKHLEQIYVKLGVENRASAAVKAANILMQG